MRPELGVVFGGFGQGMIPAPEIIDLARRCEAWGLDSVWYRDHLLWHSPVLEPFTMLGALAAATSRVRLGTGVALLPIRNPARVAQASVTVDHLSNGRFILGVGLGGEFAPEYQISGIDRRERGRRADESLDLIRRLWTEDRIDFHGQFVDVTEATLAPKPVQQPHPPIWVGGRAEAALRRAGRFADAYWAYFMTPRRFGESLTKARAYAEAAGRPAESVGGAIVFYYHLAPTFEAARQRAVGYLNAEYQMPFDDLAERFAALGSPADCADLIGRFRAAGCGHFVIAPATPAADLSDQLQRFVEEVVPLLDAA